MALPTSSASDPRPPTSSRRRFALRLLASALVLAVLVSLLDRGEILARLSAFWRESPGVWGGCLVLFLSLHAGGAMKWRLFLSLSGARLPPRTALRFYGAGLFANLCLPTMIGGDLVRAGLAIGAAQEKEAVVLGSLADRTADLLALGVLAAAACFLSPAARDALAARSIAPSTILLAFLGLLAGAILGLALLLRASASTSLPAKIAASLAKARSAATALRARPVEAAGGFLLCLALQSGFVLLNAWLGRAMGLVLDLPAWFLVVPLAKIAAMLPVSLSGIGVREVAVAALMAPLGIARETAVAQSLVWQSVLVAGSLAGGALAAVTRERDHGA